MEKKLTRDTYLSKNIGDFPAEMTINGQKYLKVDDLRYGTNPHQAACYYKPENVPCAIGDMEILKNGKNGLSQTNLEDISYALNIVKFFDVCACAVMKHVNPSGAAAACPGDDVRTVYMKARDADSRAAFGSTVAFNTAVDKAAAAEIMSTFVECVVAPAYDDGVLDIFQDTEKYKLNRHIRIIRCGDIGTLPRYSGEDALLHRTVKVLADGSLVVAQPLTTSLTGIGVLKPAEAENARCGRQQSEFRAGQQRLRDLMTAWYINMSVRSNGVVIVKDGQTLSVGTGEQDRVGAIEQAIAKFGQKYTGAGTLDGSVMASDGFFPFEDGVETAAAAGIKAIIAPAGSLRDADVIKRANELGVALYYAPERIFSHH